MVDRRPARGGLVRIGLGVAGLLIATALVAGCISSDGDPSASPTESLGDHAIATFEVANGETFKVELTTAELVQDAAALLGGGDGPNIPIGTVVRDDPGPNAPWTWHLDPATFSFADATIEVCDGIPSDVEAEAITSTEYCPWSAVLVALDAAP
jgi:hypothetical protein